MSVIEERIEKAKKIKREYDNDFDGEKHNSELEDIIMEILNENGYGELVDIYKRIPNY